MVSGPITSWQIDGEKVETVADFIFFGSKITADSDCSHEIKRCLLAPWKKSYDQPRQYIKKNRDITWPTKVCISQSYGFSSSHVQVWELDRKEGWALKSWCFRIVVLKKTLKNPWTARRSNQSTLKEIDPEYSLEGLMLKLQYLATCCK